MSKPVLPEKVMENVLLMLEQASSKKLPASSATPRSALLVPLMGLKIASPAVCALATVAEVNNAPAEEGTANGIIQLPPNTTPKTNPRHTPRGGGVRGGPPRGGRGGEGRGG